jgi:hypothetical protein
MSATQIYLRIKRKNQTIFVHIELTDTVEALKTKLEGIVKVPRAEMRIYADVDSTLHPMADKDVLDKLGVQAEQQLALVFKQPGARGAHSRRVRVAPRRPAHPRLRRGRLSARFFRLPGRPPSDTTTRSAAPYRCAGSNDWEPIEITNDAADLETNE